jgi:hypothetical protein
METKEPLENSTALTIGKHSRLKPAKVNIKTSDGSLIHGSINLGFENRVSDIFIGSENPFIVLFEATVPGGGSGKILILNKNHIVWVEPEDGIQ